MQVDATGRTATINLQGQYTATQIEDLITKLAMLRSTMTPPVPETRQGLDADPNRMVLMESDAAMTAALRRNGGLRLWLRNRGIGWCGYEIEPARARSIAKYILAQTDASEGVDLFGEGDGQRH